MGNPVRTDEPRSRSVSDKSTQTRRTVVNREVRVQPRVYIEIQLTAQALVKDFTSFLSHRLRTTNVFQGIVSIADIFDRFGITVGSSKYNLLMCGRRDVILQQVEHSLFRLGYDCTCSIDEMPELWLSYNAKNWQRGRVSTFQAVLMCFLCLTFVLPIVVRVSTVDSRQW